MKFRKFPAGPTGDRKVGCRWMNRVDRSCTALAALNLGFNLAGGGSRLDRMAIDEVPTGTCPLCGGTIREVRKVGHWHDPVRGFGTWYSGRCGVCDVDFSLSFERFIPGEWRIDAPDANQLSAVLSEKEIDDISTKFGRYKIRGAKWQSMLGRRRPGDEVWRFNSFGGTTGIAIVRNGTPIARFEMVGDL